MSIFTSNVWDAWILHMLQVPLRWVICSARQPLIPSSEMSLSSRMSSFLILSDNICLVFTPTANNKTMYSMCVCFPNLSEQSVHRLCDKGMRDRLLCELTENTVPVIERCSRVIQFYDVPVVIIHFELFMK